jgi:uncharacterized protein YbcI
MADAQQTPRGEIAAAISNGLVRPHHEYYGKGPSKAKTYLVNDTVICVLQEGFTTVERTLIQEGDAAAVHDIRRSFQAAMKQQFTTVVEEATERKVIAYLSQIHTDPDVAVEVFLLEPAGEPLAEEHELEYQEDGSDGRSDGHHSR